MKNPQQIGLKGRTLREIKYLISKEIFNDNGYYKDNKDFDIFFNKLGEKTKQLEIFSHFYYFICQPYKNDEIRDELRLVGITSLIEGMMQKVEFKDFFQWFESDYKGVNEIKDYNKIKEEYLNKFGATKKVKFYFEKYVLEEDKENLFKCIKPFKNNKVFKTFDSIQKIASFLYKMRSDFVHKARMKCLCPKGCSVACIVVNKKPYKVNIGMQEFMKIFERSFIAFWQKQI